MTAVWNEMDGMGRGRATRDANWSLRVHRHMAKRKSETRRVSRGGRSFFPPASSSIRVSLGVWLLIADGQRTAFLFLLLPFYFFSFRFCAGEEGDDAGGILAFMLARACMALYLPTLDRSMKGVSALFTCFASEMLFQLDVAGSGASLVLPACISSFGHHCTDNLTQGSQGRVTPIAMHKKQS